MEAMLHGKTRGGFAAAALIALTLGMLPLAAGAAAQDAVVAQVASVHGNVTAQRPGEPARRLACGDRVFAGERVVTAAGSRVGLLSGDVYAQLDADSALLAGRTSEGTPDLELEAGKLRIIDRADAGAASRVGAVGAQARVRGNDAEAYVLREKIGAYAMFCEWDEPLEVSRGSERATAKPGRCVIAKAREPLYEAPAHEERLALAAPEEGQAGPVIGAAPDHFTPTDVAAGPPQFFTPPLPGPPVMPPRSPCDDPGSGCMAVVTTTPIVKPRSLVCVARRARPASDPHAASSSRCVMLRRTARTEERRMAAKRAGREIEFRSNGEPVQGYLAVPASGRGPGVLVIQEFWGLVDHIRDVCDRFAREGFVTLAPDLYRGESTADPDEAGRLMLGLEIPRAARDLDGAVQALQGREEVEGSRVAAVGFCMGGQLALFAATRNPKIGAVVDFYGVHPNVTLDLAGLEAAVLGIFAEQDQYVTPETARKLEADLKGAGKRVQFQIFPGVDHAFFNDTRPDVYNAATTARAWAETLAFLRAELL
jgi:carboxymethylenebutenolidase